MIRIYSQGDNEAAYKTDYICSSPADISDLPTDIAPWSTALVPDNGALTVYLLSPDGVWAGPY